MFYVSCNRAILNLTILTARQLILRRIDYLFEQRAAIFYVSESIILLFPCPITAALRLATCAASS